MSAITATYRLQLTRAFPFAAARELVGYFAKLGISHVYLSPVLAARPGSLHGYDVIDYSRVNPELGTEEELRAFAADLGEHGMGIVLDIVPNHMAASDANPYWDDVLERGQASRYAPWFDIDWEAPHARGKIVLPVLSDDFDRVLDRDELKLDVRESGARVAYFDKTFPLDPATLPKELQQARLDAAGRLAAEEWAAGREGRARLRAVLEAQNYRLRFWGKAHTEINYRRFFDINDLIALRMETDEIFDATHKLVLAWVGDGVVDGLRVDHIDGISAPAWYLAKLRSAVDTLCGSGRSERFPIFVEKILSGDEKLPSDWAVEGTTGYDFMNDVEDLFLDADGFKAIEANYRGLRHNPSLEFRAVARDGKRRVLDGALRPDVLRVARVARAWRPLVAVDAIARAIAEAVVHLDVYRTYISEPGLVSESDRLCLDNALRGARDAPGVDPTAIALLEDAFFAEPSAGDRNRAELVARFQQLSGPATAKGVEDTALYVYVPLASRNEVGGQPDRPLENAHTRVHARHAARARDWPRTMLATNTHDTKRSADLRARLDTLTAMPDTWSRYTARWRRLNKPRKRTVRGKPAPDTSSEYLYYQTLLGLWPAPRPERRVDDLPDRAWLERARERLVAYMLKAAREAKTRTSWTESDTQYEKALDAFVRETMQPHDDAPLLGDVARLVAQTADAGFRVSLARVLVQCTSPGTPDVYQGDETWSFTLVDPDNRQPVDFRRRAQLLALADEPDFLRDAFAKTALGHERVKLVLLARLLRFRRDHARLFREGEYVPLLSGDGIVSDLFAYARRLDSEECVAVARTRYRRTDGLEEAKESLPLPGELAGQWRSVLTGRAIELVRVGPQLVVSTDELIEANHPCELLARVNR